MTAVTASMSMSLDGFVGPEFGDDWLTVHERLNGWLFDVASWRERQGLEGGHANIDSDVVAEEFNRTGAYVIGRNMFDFGEEPWGDDPPYRAPVFVVTHRPRPVLTKTGGTTFTFVTDGFESAIAQAKAAAGDGDVMCMGGASVIRQGLSSGLLDELQLHVAPVLLGSGIRLFDELAGYPIELEVERVIHSGPVTHLRMQPKR